MERCTSMNYAAGNMQADTASCGCRRQNSRDRASCSVDGCPLAMAYVPWQMWRDIYEPCKALETGTIFAELDKPFLGMRGVRQ